jgi:hypothetical protein
MSEMLTNEEKSGLIEEHKKNLLFNLFNIELTVIEEECKDTPDEEILSSLNLQISEINLKMSALDAELAKL